MCWSIRSFHARRLVCRVRNPTFLFDISNSLCFNERRSDHIITSTECQILCCFGVRLSVGGRGVSPARFFSLSPSLSRALALNHLGYDCGALARRNSAGQASDQRSQNRQPHGKTQKPHQPTANQPGQARRRRQRRTAGAEGETEPPTRPEPHPPEKRARPNEAKEKPTHDTAHRRESGAGYEGAQRGARGARLSRSPDDIIAQVRRRTKAKCHCARDGGCVCVGESLSPAPANLCAMSSGAMEWMLSVRADRQILKLSSMTKARCPRQEK